MHIGIALTDAARVDIPAVAQRAESLGFESIWAPEHLVYPVRAEDGDVPEGSYPDMAKTLDPFIVLTAAAAVTERIKLGTGVCLVPQRHPLLTAKLVSSLDAVSRGRFLFGIGAGWLEAEARLFGADFPRRWSQTRDYIHAMKAWWAAPRASYRGEFAEYGEVWRYPEPTRPPHPPILIAGAQEKLTARIVEYGDGWIPVAWRIEPGELEGRRKSIEAALKEAGRDTGEFTVTIFGAKPDPEINRAYAGGGADRVVHFVRGGATERTLEKLEQYAELIG